MVLRFCACCILLATYLTAPAQPDQALLYKVTGNGLAAPSYLYGTFHMLCSADLVISDSTRRAFDAAQKLYLELDTDDTTLLTDMEKLIFLPTGKTASDYLSADDYRQLDTYLTSAAGMGLAQLGNLKPLRLVSMLYRVMLQCLPASYDLKFAQMASQQKKEILGLENLTDQLQLFDKKPLEKQYRELAELARHPAEAQQEFGSLLAAYKNQDLRQLQTLIRSSRYAGDMADLEADLLTHRNANWIPVIERAARTQPTFFAFGAAHLAGEQGVVALLRRRGYTVSGIGAK